MLRPITCLLAVCLASLILSPALDAAAQDEAEVYVARIDGEIDGQAARYVGRVISEAGDANARAVVISLDTPGGALDSTQEMVEEISNAQEVPIIAYVSPQGAQAASAGTFILMASDVAAMAPQTRTGAATPITAWGSDIPGDLGEKVRNDAAAFITGLADAHGRNEKWAESAVQEGAAIDAGEAREIGVVEHVEPDLRSVLEVADGERVEPKGITLRTEDASLIQQEPTFEDRFGFSAYYVAVPMVLVVLAVAGAALAAQRTNRWRVSTGREGMIGEVGTVRRRVSSPSGGMVFVHGEIWKALPEDPESAPLEPGSEVEVVGFRRTSIIVRAAEPVE